MCGPVLTIYGDVGPVTGDIEHSGDIRIFGSVRPGRRVRAGGGLRVSRDVRRAELLSGKDLVVHGLAAGQGTLLDAVGSVTARQAVEARILAGRGVTIRTSAERCEIFAGTEVRVDRAPGVIRGGTIRAGRGVTARRVEPWAGRPGVLRVGVLPFPEVRDDLEARLRFAREQGSLAALVAELERRLRRLDAAGPGGEPPFVTVTGYRSPEFRIGLGEVEEDGEMQGRPVEAPFTAVLHGDEVRVTRPGEVARVG